MIEQSHFLFPSWALLKASLYAQYSLVSEVSEGCPHVAQVTDTAIRLLVEDISDIFDGVPFLKHVGNVSGGKMLRK